MKKQIWMEDNNHYVATKKFLANAKYFGTPEYYELRAAMADHPDFKVEVRKINKNPEKNTYKNLSYKNMESFISNCEPELISEYNLARQRSKVQASPYKWMVKWFNLRFPDYKETDFFKELGTPIAAIMSETVSAARA